LGVSTLNWGGLYPNWRGGVYHCSKYTLACLWVQQTSSLFTHVETTPHSLHKVDTFGVRNLPLGRESCLVVNQKILNFALIILCSMLVMYSPRYKCLSCLRFNKVRMSVMCLCRTSPCQKTNEYSI